MKSGIAVGALASLGTAACLAAAAFAPLAAAEPHAPLESAAASAPDTPSPSPSPSAKRAKAAASGHVAYVPETDSLVLKSSRGIAEVSALEPGQTCVIPEKGVSLGTGTPSVNLEAGAKPLSGAIKGELTEPISIPQVEVGELGSCSVAEADGFLVRTYNFTVTPDLTAVAGATYELKPASLGFFVTIS